MKIGFYVKDGQTSMYLCRARFTDDNHLMEIGEPEKFSTFSDFQFDETPAIEGYKGPIDLRTGNTIEYEKWKKTVLKVHITDRMETKKILFWEGDDFDEYRKQITKANEYLEFLGVGGRSGGNARNYTFFVHTSPN